MTSAATRVFSPNGNTLAIKGARTTPTARTMPPPPTQGPELLILTPHRANHAGELVARALGVLRGTIIFLRHLVHQLPARTGKSTVSGQKSNTSETASSFHNRYSATFITY
jgi:hypothetical protein